MCDKQKSGTVDAFSNTAGVQPDQRARDLVAAAAEADAIFDADDLERCAAACVASSIQGPAGALLSSWNAKSQELKALEIQLKQGLPAGGMTDPVQMAKVRIERLETFVEKVLRLLEQREQRELNQ